MPIGPYNTFKTEDVLEAKLESLTSDCYPFMLNLICERLQIKNKIACVVTEVICIFQMMMKTENNLPGRYIISTKKIGRFKVGRNRTKICSFHLDLFH